MKSRKELQTMELKLRKDMNPEFQWDVSHIFADNKAWETAYDEVTKVLPALEALSGTLNTSAESLKSALDTFFAENLKMEIVYIYAMLCKAADGGDSEAQTMMSKAASLYSKFSSAVSFFTPEILSMEEDKMEAFMQTGLLDEYRHYLDDLTRSRKYTLDAEREKMLAMLTDTTSSFRNSYDALTDVDMELPKVHDESGNEQQLTSGNFSVFRESPVRAVREEAFEGMFGHYKKFINTITEMYSGSVKNDCFLSSVRGYESAAHAAMFEDNAPLSVYTSLIDAVHSYLPSMKKYLNLRSKTMKLETIDLFDLYTPMVAEVDYPMPYEDAKDLVKKALLPLGEEYQKLLDKAYSEKWIDVYENKGKQSGAFSCGVYGVHPYIKLNYTDTLDDAFTLAHELGHAMHSYFSNQKQTYANSDYRIMVAEVASTCNEVLLTKYLLSVEKDPMRRAYILNHFLEGFRTTVFRQTLFAEFEYKAHQMYEEGKPLTPDSLSATYEDLLKLYYDGAAVPEVMKYEWSYIPHFYRAFYVYKYATGFSSAVAIANNILETGDASNYLEFLSLGGSDYPVEELRVAGINLDDPETVKSALKVFDETIDELAELLK